jgi:lipopolysaccharide export system permease protein
MSTGELLHPRTASPTDAPKWIAEAHKRLATPLTSLSYALIGLFAVLSGTFRRHGSFLRPLAAISAVVLLLAFGLAMDNLAARNNAVLAMVWLHAVAPGSVCAWLLFGPQWRGWRRHALATA